MKLLFGLAVVLITCPNLPLYCDPPLTQKIIYEYPFERTVEDCLHAELATTGPQCPEVANEVVPIQRWEGTDSQFARSEIKLVRDAEHWGDLWKSHQGSKPIDSGIPEIDFSKNLVFAWFVLGSAGDSRVVTRFVDVGPALHAYTLYQPAQRVMGDPSLQQTAYGIYVIPRRENIVWLNRRELMQKNAGFTKRKLLWRNRLLPSGLR